MALWISKPNLESGEVIQWQSLAGRSLNRWITSGGQLMVTDRRILFQPNRFDVATGKKRWECPLRSVTDVEEIDHDLTVLAGGMRKRLQIQASGSVESFAVNDLEKKVVELREIILPS